MNNYLFENDTEGHFVVAFETQFLKVIDKSRFLCYVETIADEDAAKDYIKRMKTRFFDATHICYAYIADDKGLIQKFSDNGEPQGTAGLPMLEVLKAQKMYRTIAVVVRYFGGIKLGKGGLSRAYGGIVADCLKKAIQFYTTKSRIMELKADYSYFSKISTFLKNCGTKVLREYFNNNIEITFAYPVSCDVDFPTILRNLLNGKMECRELRQEFVVYD